MTANTPPPSTTPAATVRLSAEEREALNHCPHCGGRVYQHNDLGRTVNKTVCGLSLQEARVAAVERILADRAQMALADLARAERRLAAVEALVGKWEASAVEAESIAQARIGIADVMDYLVAAVVRRQCARDLNTALTADQPTTGGDEAGL